MPKRTIDRSFIPQVPSYYTRIISKSIVSCESVLYAISQTPSVYIWLYSAPLVSQIRNVCVYFHGPINFVDVVCSSSFLDVPTSFFFYANILVRVLLLYCAKCIHITVYRIYTLHAFKIIFCLIYYRVKKEGSNDFERVYTHIEMK